MKRTRVLASLAVVLLLPLTAPAQQVEQPSSQQPAQPDRAALEKQLQEMLSGVVLKGNYTVAGGEYQSDEPKPRADRYTITKVTKLQNDLWLFHARIQFGKQDVTVPVPLVVKWAGDTPVITVTDIPIPGLGTYTARVLIYRGQYAGTWSGGDHGGHLWGRIEKLEVQAETKQVIGELPMGTNTGPPKAVKRPKIYQLHGDERQDDYYWLRDKESAEVVAYLEAENAYANRVMKPTKALQEVLYKEIVGRVKQTDLSVPYRDGDYFYYSRTEEGKQHRIRCRKKGSLDAPEQVLLDINELAKGEKFMAIREFEVSDDGHLLAYTTDNTGFREYTLHVKDLRTGELRPERIERVKSVAWAADNRTLFYTVDDHAKRPYQVYRLRLGSKDSRLVYEEKDERFRVGVWRSRSKNYLFVSSHSHTTSEIRYLLAERPTAALKLIAARKPDREYSVDHGGKLFYIRTNDRGRNFRLVTAPVRSPGPKNWKEVIAHRDDVMLEGVAVFADHYVATEREAGVPQVRIVDLRSGGPHRIEFPDPVYAVYPNANREFRTSVYRFSYTSLTTPRSVFDYDVVTRQRQLLKQTEVLGGYEPSEYESERLHATAKDGTKIPISLVYKKGFERNGYAPMLLVGYGSYGNPYSVSFSSDRLSLLDRGAVFAIAHIRGGGEMGKKWHDQGRMFSKMNTFTDFIAAAEFLIEQGYTNPGRLVIQGGSAGGLLMGAVANMRPDLFKAVVSKVPFVDVLNTMLDENLPLTVGEFEEWGNPKIKEQYEYIKQYAPYTNIQAQAYPAMLLKTSIDDSQVMYWEPAKYIAKLRAHKTNDNVLLLVTNMAGGHGGYSGRYEKWRETAFDYAFIVHQLGIQD